MALRARANVEKVIVGKGEVVDFVLVALLCEGHVLLEDVPGIGKTMLAKSVARTLGCSFRRLQFTPDLLPSDVTGLRFFNQKEQEFEFHPGPIFAQIVLADEINRATPRTQSALLECMDEQQVTVEGETHPLPRPFLVLATQNPIELEGTFPLPEAQLDRFLLRLSLGYPSGEEERTILRRFRATNPLEVLVPVVSGEELLAMQAICREVHVSEPVEDYVLALVAATRRHPAIELGASPRGALALYHAAQALAALRGRGFVVPDDVKRLARPVLAHRLIASAQTRLRGRGADELLAEVLAGVPVPVEEAEPPTLATGARS
ncbi:MAG: MoxR family ATPase [Chloroflexi bacterium]|nr:MoxR family ATPase [Chloroflexota bacterium]MCL5108011.1 MoxR family ATPase [Chloroflexota bacterium]